jgi:hypothetical protein
MKLIQDKIQDQLYKQIGDYFYNRIINPHIRSELEVQLTEQLDNQLYIQLAEQLSHQLYDQLKKKLGK